jgi:diaphanous 2
MQKKMTLLYKDMGKFYAFDIKKYTMEEFFQDLKTFKDSFSVSIIMFGKQKFI